MGGEVAREGGMQMQCGEEITTTDTWKLKGNKDYNLYRRQAVSSGLDLWFGPSPSAVKMYCPTSSFLIHFHICET